MDQAAVQPGQSAAHAPYCTAAPSRQTGSGRDHARRGRLFTAHLERERESVCVWCSPLRHCPHCRCLHLHSGGGPSQVERPPECAGAVRHHHRHRRGQRHQHRHHQPLLGLEDLPGPGSRPGNHPPARFAGLCTKSLVCPGIHDFLHAAVCSVQCSLVKPCLVLPRCPASACL